MAYRLLQVWWFVRRPQTRGVKLVIRRGDEVLFVRHTYGDRRIWELPGGGRRRRETPEAAARREAGEELGIDVSDWATVGHLVVRRHATADLVCLAAQTGGAALRLNRGEIQEARWAPVDDPPQPLGEHAAEILAFPGLMV